MHTHRCTHTKRHLHTRSVSFLRKDKKENTDVQSSNHNHGKNKYLKMISDDITSALPTAPRRELPLLGVPYEEGRMEKFVGRAHLKGKLCS